MTHAEADTSVGVAPHASTDDDRVGRTLEGVIAAYGVGFPGQIRGYHRPRARWATLREAEPSKVPVPTRLLLIRHGESPHNLDSRLVSTGATGLTRRGMRQAEWLAAHLADRERVDALCASTMDRARRTAQVIAERTGLVPRLVDELREWDFGDCEGLTPVEIEARYPGQLSVRPAPDDLTWGWPGGESRAVFYARARRVISDIAASHPDATVAVVSHNGLLTSYLAQALDGAPWSHAEYDFGHCAIAEVEVEGAAARLVQRTACPDVD